MIGVMAVNSVISLLSSNEIWVSPWWEKNSVFFFEDLT